MRVSTLPCASVSWPGAPVRPGNYFESHFHDLDCAALSINIASP